jgi:hypothetical protein
VRAVQAHPDLELVGGFVYSAEKAGRDLGEICGVGPIGIRTTSDKSEIFALPADCVLYNPEGEGDREMAINDICRLLASGKNVVSTAVTVLIYPKAAGGTVVDQLQAACREGGTSFHATGIQPGWAAEVLPLTMSCLFRRIDSILVQEILDYSSYPSASTLFDRMGFGRPPRPHPPVSMSPDRGTAFHAPLLMLADALGATIEEVIYTCEFAVAEEPFDIAAGRIERGTVSGKRYAYSAMVDGRPALTIEHVTRIGRDAAPQWPSGRGWKVTIDGSPSMALEARIATDGGDENDDACLGAAMHAVHAIAPVCAAPPGIRTFLDLPQIVGRNVLGHR